MMRALIAAHHFPPTHTGGAELRAYRTASHLRDEHNDVHVICVESIDTVDSGELAFDDTLYDRLPVRRLSFDLRQTPDSYLWSYDNRWIGEHLRTYLKEITPDIFHLIGGYLMSGRALRVARELDIPTVVSLTDFWFLCPRISLLRSDGRRCMPPVEASVCARCLGEEKRRFRFLAQVLPEKLTAVFWRSRGDALARVKARRSFLQDTLNQVDVIISPSRFLRRVHVDAGIRADHIVVSRQGRDFPDLTPALLKKTSSDRLRVGYIGQIAPLKGIHILFEAVKRLDGVPMVVSVYGDQTRFPGYTRRLEGMARDDSRLELSGRFVPTELSRVLQEVDVIVVPSIWYENSPNVILEAFAHRTPVVASDLGGMAELVRDGENGLLFKTGDASSLADRLRRLVEEPDLTKALRTGIEPVRGVEQEMRELQTIYDGLLDQAAVRSKGSVS